MKKLFLIVFLVVLLIIIAFGIIAINLTKDFGINNLDKSLLGLYQVKMNKDIDYIEVSENTYVVKNQKKSEQLEYNKDETGEDLPDSSIFKICKDNILYSVVKFEKSI